MAASHEEIGRRLDDLERDVSSRLGVHDEYFAAIFRTLRRLTEPEPRSKRRIGFAPPDEEK